MHLSGTHPCQLLGYSGIVKSVMIPVWGLFGTTFSISPLFDFDRIVEQHDKRKD